MNKRKGLQAVQNKIDLVILSGVVAGGDGGG